MKRRLGMVLSVLLAGATALGGSAAVQAAPIVPQAAASIGTGGDVLQVRDGGRRWIHRGNRGSYGGRHYAGRDYGHGRYYGHRRGSYGPAFGLGLGLGLGTGYYYGGYPYYSQPYYYSTPRIYASRGSDWKRACARRYRSFDWRSGTYVGYDGRRHLCRL